MEVSPISKVGTCSIRKPVEGPMASGPDEFLV